MRVPQSALALMAAADYDLERVRGGVSFKWRQAAVDIYSCVAGEWNRMATDELLPQLTV